MTPASRSSATTSGSARVLLGVLGDEARSHAGVELAPVLGEEDGAAGELVQVEVGRVGVHLDVAACRDRGRWSRAPARPRRGRRGRPAART
jgi:hypothetical protein